MSLLLDALKKAAEKKARKNAEGRAEVEKTGVNSKLQQPADEQTLSAREAKEIDTTRVDKTEAELTQVDATQIENTRIDATEVDVTDIEHSPADLTELDQTELDATEVNSNHIEHPESDATEIDPAQADSDDIENTRIDAAPVNDADIEQTQIDATAADSTDIESTQIDYSRDDETEIDSLDEDKTELDRTELDITDIHAADGDITLSDNTEIKATAVDADALQFDVVEKEHTDTENQLENAYSRDTEPTDKHTLTDEDKTLLFYEDEGDDVAVPVSDEEERAHTETLEIENIYSRRSAKENETLTDDDVTEFMGDGLTAEEVDAYSRSREIARKPRADDTTITNRDTLSLTNLDEEELSLEHREDAGYPLAGGEYSASDLPSSEGYDGRTESDISAPEYTLEAMHNEDSSNAEPTSSTIDIDKLTSDETVTIKDSTATRTFAPDNYDRTLLKLAESDVSRIFPGMKAETDKVMTPDYAKKVFLNKSHGINNWSYKVYGGIALLIMLTVSVWGLFELQDELETIDRSLIGLKRDPMPGIIKPKNVDDSNALFPLESDQGQQKIIGILASSEDSDGAGETAQGEQGNEQAGDVQMVTDSNATDGSQQATGTDMQSGSTTELTAVAENNQQVAKVGNAGVTGKDNQQFEAGSRQQQAPPVKQQSTDLVISSSSKISRKDQLLSAAYAAYESGDNLAAARLYDQALSLEPENRDALLGRAAIYVRNNQASMAIDLYQKLLESNPKDSMAMTSLISVANIDPLAGESQIKSLLREQPASPYLHFALGNMYGSQRRWIEAQSSYFTALSHKPRDPDYAYNLAVSLEHIQKPETAITYYQLALDNNTYGRAAFDSQLVGQRIEVLSQ